MNQAEYYMGLPCDLSGSRAKNRFRLELLWGVSKMLELMESADDFTIVFDLVCDIEIHFDDKFEFYQIKTHKESQPKYTAKSLVKIKSGEEGSILGKLFVLNKDGSVPVKVPQQQEEQEKIIIKCGKEETTMICKRLDLNERPIFPKRAIITAGMPYGNKNLHFGHVGGMFIHADIFSRFLRDRIGKDNVIFLSGTDCYGSPIMESYRKLQEEGYDGTLQMVPMEELEMFRKYLLDAKYDEATETLCHMLDTKRNAFCEKDDFAKEIIVTDVTDDTKH